MLVEKDAKRIYDHQAFGENTNTSKLLCAHCYSDTPSVANAKSKTANHIYIL